MFSVVVYDKYLEDSDEDFYNSLIFNFNSKEGAIEFVNKIISISNYSVKIIPYMKGE